jgi:hypothetical protein
VPLPASSGTPSAGVWPPICPWCPSGAPTPMRCSAVISAPSAAMACVTPSGAAPTARGLHPMS